MKMEVLRRVEEGEKPTDRLGPGAGHLHSYLVCVNKDRTWVSSQVATPVSAMQLTCCWAGVMSHTEASL